MVTLFIYLQRFGKQRVQGAPVRDIFKSPFLANTVSERSNISLSFYITDLKGSKDLFWHPRVGEIRMSYIQRLPHNSGRMGKESRSPKRGCPLNGQQKKVLVV